MNQMIENAMVVGDYYPPSKVSTDERADELLCDAMNLRTYAWASACDAQEVLMDVATKLLQATDFKEAYVEARAVLEAVIEDWADTEARNEE